MGAVSSSVILLLLESLLAFSWVHSPTFSSYLSFVFLLSVSWPKYLTSSRLLHHQRYDTHFNKHSYVSVSVKGSSLFSYFYYLVGDVETNPGASNDEVKCVCRLCSSCRELCLMLQCELYFCYTLPGQCVNIIAGVIYNFSFIFSFYVKSSLYFFSNLKTDLTTQGSHC